MDEGKLNNFLFWFLTKLMMKLLGRAKKISLRSCKDIRLVPLIFIIAALALADIPV